MHMKKILIMVGILIGFTNYGCFKVSSISTKEMIGNSLKTVGRYTYYFSDMEIIHNNEGAPLAIGQFCSIGQAVTIFLGNYHRSDWITTFPFGHIYEQDFGGKNIVGHPTTKGGVTIGNDVWIGRGATIMSGVTIGDGAIVGACAVVAKNVEPYSVVVGNPARHVKYRFDSDMRDMLLQLRWWDLEVNQIRECTHILCSSPNAEIVYDLLKKYRNIK